MLISKYAVCIEGIYIFENPITESIAFRGYFCPSTLPVSGTIWREAFLSDGNELRNEELMVRGLIFVSIMQLVSVPTPTQQNTKFNIIWNPRHDNAQALGNMRSGHSNKKEII